MSNPADTALALLVLTAAGYNDTSVIAKTINYLTARQNPDGGWSAALDQGSSISPTANVLSALNAYRSAYPLESAINSGMSWLTQKQNPDGGFGNSPSTVYDTAVAVLALRELAASTVITNNGLGYLKSKQTGTGSWNESAYQTALAVHALWKGEVDPDLSIVSSDITFIPATITSIPATIAINANIWNLGKTGVSQATVALFDGNPALGNKLSEQVMAFPGQSATTVAFSTVVNDETSHTYSVIVDPAGQVNETDELNNTASKTLPVDVAPPTVGFTLASSSGDESAASATLQVSLNKQYYKPVTVDYTINATSTATNGVDYSLTAGTLTFNPGETTKSVELYIINDSLYEANETVVIDLSNPVNATLGQSQHTYTIIDNDILLPVVTIISPLAGETPNKTPLLLYEVSSGTVVVKVDGVVVNKASGDQLASLVDGNHVVQVEATDSYGHTGYGVVSFTVTANGPIDDTVVTEPPYETLFTIPTGTGTAYADEGNKVAVDPDGNVIISRAGYIAKYDSLGVLKWETPAAADTSLKDVATDSCGNVYSNGTATYSTRWDRNAALTKIDTKGAIVAGWPKKWGSIQNDDANGMAVDVSGNPSVTGKTDGPIDGSWNVNYYEHIFLTRFDGSGAMTVNRQYYGNEGKDIVTDSDGNVYIAGRKDFNFFVGKYDSKGNQLWTSTSQPEGVDKAAYVIAIDLNRNLYVSAGGGLVKLDSSGNLMWTRTFQVEPVSSYVYIGDLAVDRSGNVYAAGYTGGSMDGNTNQGLSDLFVVKYDSRGNLVWTRQIGSTGYDHGYGIAIDENDDLYVTANGKLDASGTYKVFLLKFARTGPDPFQPLGTKYYVQSASGCKQTTYSRGTAYAQLGTSKGSCTGPDTTRIRFSGSQNLLIAYAANGGYSKDTLVKGLPEGNALSFLAQDSNGTGLVQLVEVNPSDGTVLRTLSSVSVALTAGRLGYVGDLSTLSGIVQAGKTFGISLSISTDLRSYNQVQWGNAHNCPIGSMQYFTVTETAVETQPPSSTITSPIQGQILGGAYHVVSGTAGDGTGSGVISVEVSTDGGVTWGVATDTSGSSSWSSWSYPWVLPADGTYTIRSRAKDLDGNVETPSAGVTITADNTPPSVGISPIKTPTGVSNQTVTGTRESGASIAVTVDTMAVPGTVSYPTATTWSCAITGLIEGANIITVTATDQAGHSSVATATIMYAYSPPPTISLTPADIMDDYQGTVKLVISSLSAPGTEISVEQLIDSNQNGIADIGEPVVRSFKLIDGTASGNPNVQGDEDGLANSSITTMLNYFNVHDRYHAPGAYVFRVSADTGTVGALFAVNAVSRLQTLSGWISDGTNAIPGALVTLVDKWGREIESVTSDHAGHYLFNVREQGDYYTIPIANGYAFDRSTALLVSLSASQATTGHDLTMIPGTYHVTGQVKDAATSAGIGGVWVWAEGSKYVGGVISNTDGSYDLLLPAGTYAVGSPPNSGPDASLKGYVGYNLRKTSVTLTGNVSGIDIAMNRSDILACGRVADDFGSSVPGIMIQGKIPSPVNADEPIAVSVTNDSGDYCLGLYSADKWEISPVTDAAQVSGYIGNMIKSLSTSAGPLTGNNLTVHAINSWIAGSVKNSSNAALKDIDVKIRNTDSSINTSGKTASDGTYRLGVFGGLWYVKAYTEAQGYAPAAEQSVTATDGQSTTVNFTANPVMNNTIVILKAVYTARTKTLLVQASSNNGASAALQLQGYGAMTWNAKLSYWELTVSNVLSAPATVTVVGPEGSKTGNVTIK